MKGILTMIAWLALLGSANGAQLHIAWGQPFNPGGWAVRSCKDSSDVELLIDGEPGDFFEIIVSRLNSRNPVFWEEVTSSEVFRLDGPDAAFFSTTPVPCPPFQPGHAYRISVLFYRSSLEAAFRDPHTEILANSFISVVILR